MLFFFFIFYFFTNVVSEVFDKFFIPQACRPSVLMAHSTLKAYSLMRRQARALRLARACPTRSPTAERWWTHHDGHGVGSGQDLFDQPVPVVERLHDLTLVLGDLQSKNKSTEKPGYQLSQHSLGLEKEQVTHSTVGLAELRSRATSSHKSYLS